MNDPLIPRVPSLGSMLTFGMRNPNAPPAVPTEAEQFTIAMLQRGVTAIRDKEPKEE